MKRRPESICTATEVAARADFSRIRYAQVWEDADILLEALNPKAGSRLLSIASAGDNALALLARDPRQVVAVDLNPAQLACLELRMAALRNLDPSALLELVGSRGASGEERRASYRRCRGDLSPNARRFWDNRQDAVANGIGGAGKFENYFRIFRKRCLPLVHSRKKVMRLLAGQGDRPEREHFYERHWNTWRWRLLFRMFFSRAFMGLLGRDRAFFRYVEGSVANRILERTRHALVELNPADNPYLQWILTGTHQAALPAWLRAENIREIRGRLDRIELFQGTVEDYLERHPDTRFDGFNLSDIFEYMSEENTHRLLEALLGSANPGARLAYWNMLVPRSRPASMSEQLLPLTEQAERLHLADKAFFYNRFILEEVAGR